MPELPEVPEVLAAELVGGGELAVGVLSGGVLSGGALLRPQALMTRAAAAAWLLVTRIVPHLRRGSRRASSCGGWAR